MIGPSRAASSCFLRKVSLAFFDTCAKCACLRSSRDKLRTRVGWRERGGGLGVGGRVVGGCGGG